MHAWKAQCIFCMQLDGKNFEDILSHKELVEDIQLSKRSQSNE